MSRIVMESELGHLLSKLVRGAMAPLAGITFVVVGIGGVTSASAASISGKWHGNGIATSESGEKEKLRCQVTYGRIAGQDFSVNARCASGAGRLTQIGQLTRVSKGKYVGDILNKEYNVRARVLITVDGEKQNVEITSSKGGAKLHLIRQ